MKNLIFLFLLIPSFAIGQANGISKEFKTTIDDYLSFSVPTVTVDQLDIIKDDVVILDAREKDEYNVSHIPGAIYIGYNQFDKRKLSSIDKSKKIVVYCSIGYRSEKIGEKLQEEGFSDVYNLYGSIFAWGNAGKPLVDKDNKETVQLHGFDKSWSKWIVNPKLQKIH